MVIMAIVLACILTIMMTMFVGTYTLACIIGMCVFIRLAIQCQKNL